MCESCGTPQAAWALSTQQYGCMYQVVIRIEPGNLEFKSDCLDAEWDPEVLNKGHSLRSQTASAWHINSTFHLLTT
jgi:hypothetical protein